MATLNKVNSIQRTTPALRDAVRTTVEKYLKECGDMPPNNLYQLVLEEVQEPMLQVLMKYANNNQCKVTEILGLARGTVRKLLKKYGFIKSKR